MGITRRLRGLFSIRRHHLMRLSIPPSTNKAFGDTVLQRVENPEQVVNGTYDASTQLKLMEKNGTLCEQYVLRSRTGEMLGTLSVMYRGGNELEYRVRHIDAFVYNLAVVPECRGRGYAGAMIDGLSSVLRCKGIEEMYLAVSFDNENALRAYTKSGFKIVYDRTFVRTMHVNIPYYVI